MIPVASPQGPCAAVLINLHLSVRLFLDFRYKARSGIQLSNHCAVDDILYLLHLRYFHMTSRGCMIYVLCSPGPQIAVLRKKGFERPFASMDLKTKPV